MLEGTKEGNVCKCVLFCWQLCVSIGLGWGYFGVFLSEVTKMSLGWALISLGYHCNWIFRLCLDVSRVHPHALSPTAQNSWCVWCKFSELPKQFVARSTCLFGMVPEMFSLLNCACKLSRRVLAGMSEKHFKSNFNNLKCRWSYSSAQERFWAVFDLLV